VADLIGVDGYLQILIDKSGACLLNFLGEIMEGFYQIDSYNWFEMKNTERFYLDWIEAELFKTSECKNFNGYINGCFVFDLDFLNFINFFVFLLL
jgi:hypothetical protein